MVLRTIFNMQKLSYLSYCRLFSFLISSTQKTTIYVDCDISFIFFVKRLSLNWSLTWICTRHLSQFFGIQKFKIVFNFLHCLGSIIRLYKHNIYFPAFENFLVFLINKINIAPMVMQVNFNLLNRLPHLFGCWKVSEITLVSSKTLNWMVSINAKLNDVFFMEIQLHQ